MADALLQKTRVVGQDLEIPALGAYNGSRGLQIIEIFRIFERLSEAVSSLIVLGMLKVR